MTARVRLALGTRNAHKATEIREILGDLPGIAVQSVPELGLDPIPEEDEVEAFDTFLENAVAKARHFADRTGLPAIADDSGLAVDALGGAPGVRSKRFAADAGFDVDFSAIDDVNNRLLLERLEDVRREQRTASFVCVAAIAFPDGPAPTFIGACSGEIVRQPRGERGFGYDPLFYLPDLDRTFAEITPDEKNRRSHRGRAFRALASRLPALVRGLDRARDIP